MSDDRLNGKLGVNLMPLAPAGNLSGVLPQNPQPTPCVYVIDDDTDIRRSLHFALATSKITAWPFGLPEDFLDQLGTLTPAPILLDIRMPTMDGLQVLQALRDRKIEWPVIIMSGHADIPIVVSAMKLGAVEFLEKPFDLKELDRILAKSFEALAVVIASSEMRAAAVVLLQRLTPREAEVIQLSACGLTNKLVARQLRISARTVEIHRRNALAKLAVKSSAEVVRLLFEAGQYTT